MKGEDDGPFEGHVSSLTVDAEDFTDLLKSTLSQTFEIPPRMLLIDGTATCDEAAARNFYRSFCVWRTRRNYARAWKAWRKACAIRNADRTNQAAKHWYDECRVMLSRAERAHRRALRWAEAAKTAGRVRHDLQMYGSRNTR